MLVAGCGPAGAELARLLAQAGHSVWLVEQLADLNQAAFSSAALPLAALERFSLPSSLVASRWQGWQLLGPGEAVRRWQGDHTLGVVLDFGALRHWLAGEAQAWGTRLELGCRALEQRQGPDGISTLLRWRDGQQRWIQSRWLVDATGQARSLLGEPPPTAGPLVSGLGVEWLLAVSEAQEQRWRGQLSFLLGTDWLPQGYGWVFPMQGGRLKVGVCRLQDPTRPQPPLGPLLRSILGRCGLDGAEVLDRHGGLIRSTIGRLEPHRCGRLIGLGDAVSTANLLGGEGIRHALLSARVLAPQLLAALALGSQDRAAVKGLDAYPRQLRRALGWRWGLSGRLARRTWLGLNSSAADRRLERLLAGLEQHQQAEDLSALLFDYRFERYGLRALPYLLGLR
ncbi:MAG: NAD(P)/FAD-dependent oxidoreductase [Synechococcus sp. ELA619]